MKVPVDRSHGLIEVVDELLHLEEAPIEVLREHLEHCAHLVYNLMLLTGRIFPRMLGSLLLLVLFFNAIEGGLSLARPLGLEVEGGTNHSVSLMMNIPLVGVLRVRVHFS